LAIQELGWKLDYRRFRIYLSEHYGVGRAYYFIGYIEGNNYLYSNLQSAGFILIFKPTFRSVDGKIKGNCDAELVLQAMIDLNKYEKAVIVTGDGDFYCLVNYLRRIYKLECVLVPDMQRYSALLKRAGAKQIAFMNGLRKKLEYKRKEPHEDGTS